MNSLLERRIVHGALIWENVEEDVYSRMLGSRGAGTWLISSWTRLLIRLILLPTFLTPRFLHSWLNSSTVYLEYSSVNSLIRGSGDDVCCDEETCFERGLETLLDDLFKSEKVPGRIRELGLCCEGCLNSVAAFDKEESLLLTISLMSRFSGTSWIVGGTEGF